MKTLLCLLATMTFAQTVVAADYEDLKKGASVVLTQATDAFDLDGCRAFPRAARATQWTKNNETGMIHGPFTCVVPVKLDAGTYGQVIRSAYLYVIPAPSGARGLYSASVVLQIGGRHILFTNRESSDQGWELAMFKSRVFTTLEVQNQNGAPTVEAKAEASR